MSSLQLLILFIILAFGGLLLEAVTMQLWERLGHKKHKTYHYTHGRYLYSLLFPSIATFIAFSEVGFSLIYLFLLFCLLGTAAEWFLGLVFHRILGHRMWRYYKYSLGTYTSLLAIPFWGMGGVLFWLVMRVFE